MEKFTSQVIGSRPDGSKIVRNFFFNNDTTNYMAKAHSYFTRLDRKLAKLGIRK